MTRYTLIFIIGILVCLVAGCGDTPAATVKTDVQIIDALKAEGLPIGRVDTYTAETDPNTLLGRPNGYTYKSNFRDTRLEVTQPDEVDTADGGSIEVWPDEASATTRMDRIQELGKGIPMLGEYDFVHGGVLLRLSRELTPDQANEYDAALVKVLK